MNISERISEHVLSEAFISSDASIQSQSISGSASETNTDQTAINTHEQNLVIPRRTDDAQSPSVGTHTYNTVRIRASRYRRTQCRGWCSCSCHLVNYLRTPQSVDLALGSMFVGFSGFPVRRLRCSEKSCRKQSIPTLKVTYHFPQWLLARAICFSLALTYMNGPQVSLHMPRVIGSDSKIFSYAIQGDLCGLQALFQDGFASPYDVAASNGRTALHVSPQILRSASSFKLTAPPIESVCSQLRSSRSGTILSRRRSRSIFGRQGTSVRNWPIPAPPATVY